MRHGMKKYNTKLTWKLKPIKTKPKIRKPNLIGMRMKEMTKEDQK